MSGVFLTVQECERNPDESLLCATKGGYPHVTVVYTGEKLTRGDLAGLGSLCFSSVVMASDERRVMRLHAGDAHVNSFTTGRGQERHDVLLGLCEKDAATIEDLRVRFVMPRQNEHLNFANGLHPPHVTHSIHPTRSSAERALAQIKSAMPLDIEIVGLTID